MKSVLYFFGAILISGNANAGNFYCDTKFEHEKAVVKSIWIDHLQAGQKIASTYTIKKPSSSLVLPGNSDVIKVTVNFEGQKSQSEDDHSIYDMIAYISVESNGNTAPYVRCYSERE
jgi:hypothetical protein